MRRILKTGTVFASATLLAAASANAKGKYRPTFALLLDPDDPMRGDGTSCTYTVIAQ